MPEKKTTMKQGSTTQKGLDNSPIDKKSSNKKINAVQDSARAADHDHDHHTQHDWSTLEFMDPTNMGKDACVCHVAGAPLHVTLPCVRVARVVAMQQTDCVTLSLHASKDLVRSFLLLDKRCLFLALANCSSWFMHRIKADLIEDFFRPSTELIAASDGNNDGGHKNDTRSSAVAVRLKVMVPEGELIPNVREGQWYNMAFTLLGLQFRKQHFCVLWKLAAVHTVNKPRSTPTMRPAYNQYLIGGSDDGSEGTDNDTDVLDEDILQCGFSSAADVDALVSGMHDALRRKETYHTAQSKIHRAALTSLKSIGQRLSHVQGLLEDANLRPTLRVSDALKTLNVLSDELATLQDT